MRFTEAFRLQAQSDLETYEWLVRTRLPSSHGLHYLQMWLEKLCKAHLWLPSAENEASRFEHQVVGRVLPRLIQERWRRLDAFQNQKPPMQPIRELCREIDLLHPQVKGGDRRLDNVEYPWMDAQGQSCVPAAFKFSLKQRLAQNPGRALLKAAVQLTRDSNLLFV